MPSREIAAFPSHHYSLTFEPGLAWRFEASAGAAAWLDRFARTLLLRADSGDSRPFIRFFRGSMSHDRLGAAAGAEDPGLKDRLEREGWSPRNLTVLRVWSHPETDNRYCELLKAADPSIESLMMWQSLHLLYERAILMGAAPVHAAMAVKDGKAVLLAGAGGAGKSTCCRRLPAPWRVVCDDECLIARDASGRFRVHPLPTWKDCGDRGGLSWDVEESFPLAGVFFLEKSPFDEVSRLSASSAAAALIRSAHEACFRQLELVERSFRRAWRVSLFQNVCDLLTRTGAFALKVSLEGRFWEHIESCLAERRTPPR